jgi:hypothetical protein
MTGATIMSRLTQTTAIAMVLSLPALTGAHAFNTTPVTYGPPNTTINSSVKPAVVPNTIYSQPNTTINSSIKPATPSPIYSQPNTTINSSIKPYVVPNTIYSQPNTTINSSIKPFIVPNSGMMVPQATLQSMAAQAAAGKAASLVTIASQSAIAQNAQFVPKGAPTELSQLSGHYATMASGAPNFGDLAVVPSPGAVSVPPSPNTTNTQFPLDPQTLNSYAQLQSSIEKSLTDLEHSMIQNFQAN